MISGECLFLGTGGSGGVPMIGCTCAVCTSSHPFNHRLRPSVLIRLDKKNVLIDAGPDFRFQALRYSIRQLDGVLITHSHFDHVAGLDELRVYYLRNRVPMPLLLSEATYTDLKKRYDYLFREKEIQKSLTAQLDFHVVPGSRGIVNFLGVDIGYTPYEQGGMPVMGFRIGSLAYISDIRTYPETIFEDLRGINILILSALRKEPSIMHFNLEEATAFAKKVGAKRTFLTHMGHELDYDQGNAQLPPEVRLAYDGLKLEFDYGT
jgi:phosphoribosyl 1,2-cyclic phosphate phosphodiesterase